MDLTELWQIATHLDSEGQAALLLYARRLAAETSANSSEAEPAEAAGSPQEAPAPPAGWDEKRYITKQNGKKYGPYRYHCWEDASGRRRAKYMGRW
jgi:hypothetical protein